MFVKRAYSAMFRILSLNVHERSLVHHVDDRELILKPPNMMSYSFL